MLDIDLNKIGDDISKGAAEAGKVIEEAAKAAGKSVNEGAEVAGKAISEGANKAGRFIDETIKNIRMGIYNPVFLMILVRKILIYLS